MTNGQGQEPEGEGQAPEEAARTKGTAAEESGAEGEAMKFRIPDKVTVAGVDFKIVEAKGLGRNASKRGETQFFDRELRIDPDLSSQEKEQTFIHEVTHAIEDTFACDLRESQVKRMAHGFYQVLRQLEAEDKS